MLKHAQEYDFCHFYLYTSQTTPTVACFDIYEQYLLNTGYFLELINLMSLQIQNEAYLFGKLAAKDMFSLSIRTEQSSTQTSISGQYQMKNLTMYTN